MPFQKGNKLACGRKKQFCLRGHDTFITGRYTDGRCAECGRIQGRQSYIPVPLNKRKDRHKRFCPRGHDKDIVGRTNDGTCRQCANAHSVAYSRKYPERRKNTTLKYVYGITLDEYNNLLKKQNGKCFGCGKIPKRFDIDHDHKTGKVRGLLCHQCNCILGYAFENPSTLRKLASYLEKTTGKKR